MEKFKYPWLRSELIEYLQELSDLNYQNKNWFAPDPDKIIGISPVIDFILYGQQLQESPDGAVGLYLYSDEVPAVREVAMALSAVVADIEDIYDSAGATTHPEWPCVVSAARRALDAMNRNNKAPGL